MHLSYIVSKNFIWSQNIRTVNILFALESIKNERQRLFTVLCFIWQCSQAQNIFLLFWNLQIFKLFQNLFRKWQSKKFWKLSRIKHQQNVNKKLNPWSSIASDIIYLKSNDYLNHIWCENLTMNFKMKFYFFHVKWVLML